MSSSQYILTCDGSTREPVCTLSNYVPPEQISHYQEYGFSGTTITWILIVTGVLFLAVIIATAMVRYKAHEERASIRREELRTPTTKCPNCYVDIKK